MFERVGPHLGVVRRMVFSNMWLFEPVLKSVLTTDPGTAALIRTTTAATMIDGGVKENVLPTSSRAIVNFRILPGETTSSVIQRVRKVVDDPGIEIRPVNVFFDPSPVSRSDDETFRLFEDTILETTDLDGLIVSPFLAPAATDSRYFARLSDHVYRFLPIVVGREELETIHGSGEKVRVENVRSCASFLYRLIRRSDESAGLG
jgi:carboxypeptidase PM20D1